MPLTGPAHPGTRADRGGAVFAPAFTLFADCLLVGLLIAVTALPVVTAPSALAAGCAVLRRSVRAEEAGARVYLRLLAGRLRRPADWGAGAVAVGVLLLVLADLALAGAGLPGGPVPVLVAAFGAAVVGLRTAAAADAEGRWRTALRAGADRCADDVAGAALVALAVVTAGAIVWALPMLGMIVAGPMAFALVAVEDRPTRSGAPDGARAG